MGFEFTEQEMVIALVTSNRFPTWWRDEAYNCALEAIWTFRSEFDPAGGDYNGWIYQKAYYFVVDQQRLEFGRYGSQREQINRTMGMFDGRLADHNPRDEKTPEFYIVDMDPDVSHITAGWTTLQLQIVADLLAGRLKQDIATDLGVTPGRVSHILKPIKESWRDRT